MGDNKGEKIVMNKKVVSMCSKQVLADNEIMGTNNPNVVIFWKLEVY